MSFLETGITPPDKLATTSFILRPIIESDAELDYKAVMETRELLRKWSQSTWPEDDFTVAANRADMVKMEQRHASCEAFGYTMMNLDQTECLGCVYIFPPGVGWFAGANISPVGSGRWSTCDAMIYFWVRASRLPGGMDRLLLDTLVDWFDRDWAFEAPVFVTNEQFDQQVAMIERSDLRRRFEIKLDGDPGSYVAYA